MNSYVLRKSTKRTIANYHLTHTKLKKEKQKKGEDKRMKCIMQRRGNKRNNINSTSSNNNNTNNTSNSKYKCSVWGKRTNKKSRAIK